MTSPDLINRCTFSACRAEPHPERSPQGIALTLAALSVIVICIATDHAVAIDADHVRIRSPLLHHLAPASPSRPPYKSQTAVH